MLVSQSNLTTFALAVPLSGDTLPKDVLMIFSFLEKKNKPQNIVLHLNASPWQGLF